MIRTADAVVVGAGIIGSACAYRLAGKGLRTVLLDRGAPGSGCTAAATGVLPRASRSGSPYDLLCRDGADALAVLLGELADRNGIDLRHRAAGSLLLAETEVEAAGLRRTFEAEHARDVPCEWWTAGDLSREEPAVAPSVVGAIHYPRVASISPRRLCRALVHAFLDLGGTLCAGEELIDWSRGADGTFRLQTTQGELQAARVVLCNGAWAGLGPTNLSIDPVRGQALSVTLPAGTLRRILQFSGRHLLASPDGRTVIGATSDRVGFDDRPTAEGVAALLTDAVRAVPAIAQARFERTWSGLRPRSRNRMPIIGPLIERPGAFAAVGHHKNGVLLCAVTADRIAGWAG